MSAFPVLHDGEWSYQNYRDFRITLDWRDGMRILHSGKVVRHVPPSESWCWAREWIDTYIAGPPYECVNCGEYACTASDYSVDRNDYTCFLCQEAALVHGCELTPDEVDAEMARRLELRK